MDLNESYTKPVELAQTKSKANRKTQLEKKTGF